MGVGGRALVLPLGVMPPTEHTPTIALAKQYPQLEGKRVLLFVSRLDRVKGLDLLLKAFQTVSRALPDVVLVIAGEGEKHFVQSLHHTAEQLGISDAVIWTDFLDEDAKAAALAAADVFILPSYSENFGIAAVEALAAGVPVIVTDRVGCAAEISESAAGLVVACDPAPIAQAILQLFGDPELRKRLAQRGLKLVEDRYSFDRTADALIRVYEELARKPTTQSRAVVAAERPS
jgi:glycosyltransferase involved in cell wall biosynthesis